MSSFLEMVWSTWVPPAGVLTLTLLALYGAHRLLGPGKPGRGGVRYPYQLASSGIGLVGVVALVVALPLSAELTGQLLSLLGILLSAAVALSSTTVLGNAMAGFMLRVMRAYRTPSPPPGPPVPWFLLRSPWGTMCPAPESKGSSRKGPLRRGWKIPSSTLRSWGTFP